MSIEKSKKYRPGNLFVTGWGARVAMALALTAALLVGCGREQTSVQERQNVTTEDVSEAPNRYLGQVVTIRSEPIEKFGPSTFTVEDQQFFGSQPILVVNATGKPFVFPTDGTDVQVTGEVRNFAFADIERRYNLGLEANAYRDYENRPTLIARSLAVAPKPGELTANPQQYYGKPLAVTGEVNQMWGTNAFTLDEDRLFGGQDLLVLRAPGMEANQPMVRAGETVAVTGTLRPFVVADLEREYNFTWDAGTRQQLEVEYRNRPVFIADGIYPSAIPEGAK